MGEFLFGASSGCLFAAVFMRWWFRHATQADFDRMKEKYGRG